MTAALLKQALEALWSAAQELHHIDSGPIKELGGVIAKVEDAATALTTCDSLSEYDKAIHALAPYLPDGWVAQDSFGNVFSYSSMPEIYKREWEFTGGAIWPVSVPNFPRCEDWRKSLRRITHNSDGTVTVERG